MYKKILALRIFTIKFEDADLFAVHAVYGKAFLVQPLTSTVSRCCSFIKPNISSVRWGVGGGGWGHQKIQAFVLMKVRTDRRAGFT